MLNRILQERLKNRHQENSFRKLSSDQELLDFTSNDYLGFARSQELFRLIKDKVNTLPHRNGATGSRLLSGNSTYTEEVEQKLASIFKSEAALIFNSGYTANQAVLSSIPQKGDTILYDELAHACMRDGARLSHAKRFAFKHNDLSDIDKKLKAAEGNIFIAVESIYSMDGDSCPLRELVSLADQYNASIILDEAHSTGILGPEGSGMAVQESLDQKIPVRIYTFGKAMGIHGACVAGSRDLIDYLINYARPFIFTTAPTPHSIASIDCSFAHLSNNLTLQDKLKQRIELFTSLSREYNLSRLGSNSQIQSMVIAGNDSVKNAAQRLQRKGYDVRPILSPTVAKGSERLRMCLHTFNADEEINGLVQELSALA